MIHDSGLLFWGHPVYFNRFSFTMTHGALMVLL